MKRILLLVCVALVALPAMAHVDVFGPKSYTVSAGAPQPVTETIALAGPCDLVPSAVYTLVIANDGVSSASIRVNGSEVAGADDFNQQTTLIERQVILAASNTLTTTVKGGTKTGKLTLTIRRHIDLTEAVFGEKTYTTTGNSNSFHDTFNAAGGGTFSIIVRNGTTAVKSGSVRLNGIEVVTRQELEASAVVRKSVTLAASNQLMVDTKSDAAGASLHVTVVRHLSDTTGPQIVHGLTAGQTVAANPLAIAGTVSDSSVVAAFAINGTAVVLGAGGAFSTSLPIADGQNLIRFDATDCEGNTTHAEVTVTLENAPALTIRAPQPDAFSRSLTIAMSGTVSAAGGIQSVLANGTAMNVAGNSWSGDVTLSAGEGPRELAVVATDTGGRQTTKVVTVRIDTIAPLLQMSVPSPAVSRFNIRDLPVSGFVSDAGSAVQVTCNGTAATVDADGVYRCGLTLALGPTSLEVVARDEAGNQASISRVIEYAVDTVRPTIVPVVTPAANAFGWITSLPFVDWRCEDDQIMLQCTLGADVFEDGANLTFTGKAVDGAGNEATASVTLNIDSRIPTIEPDVPQAGIITNGTARINGTFGDLTSGVKSVTCNGVPAVLSGTTFDCSVTLVPGFQDVTIIATDHAGHTASRDVGALLDTAAPGLELFTPAKDDVLTSERTLEVTGSVSDDDRVALVTVAGTEVPLAGNEFAIDVPLTEGASSIVVAVTDRAGNVASRTLQVRSVARPDLHITTPRDFVVTSESTVTVSGTVSGSIASLDVNGVPAQIANGIFTAAGVPLAQGRTVITATAHGTNGEVAADHLNVYRDSIRPRVVVYSPASGEVVTTSSIAVTGMVDDIVIGTINAGQVQVTVNAVQAQVANRAFVAENVPLTAGVNTLTIEATDQAGNTSTGTHTVTLTAAGRRIVEVGGNGQSAAIGTELPQPLRVKLLDDAGAPVAGQLVTFTVIQNDGTLSDGTFSGREVQVSTGAGGEAAVELTLGHRAGAGNNRVQATAAGFAGAVEFHANAATGAPALVVVDMGNNQFGVSSELLPRPLVAVVVDAGSNRLANVPVTFTVLEGDGTFDGQPSLVVLTDSDGRAEAKPRLGPGHDNDNNRFAAMVPGVEQMAMFTVTGRRAGPPEATRISGVLMDNVNQPVQGVTVRIDETTRSTATDAQGLFAFDGAPVGYVKLIVDGSTAQRPGTWPTLEFAMYTNAGQDNTIGMPIYLLPIDVTRGIQVTETTGGTLTFAELPGFALTVAPGSALFPNGSRAGTVSATLVHADKMPMTPGFGQQPRFIVTIQPPGVHFDPPAKLTLPNLDGMAPGEITELYSFDHDLGQFIAIGTGTVSEDGTTVVSDPGVGIIKGGWHCGGNPNPTGTACTITVSAVATVSPQDVPPATEVDTDPDPDSLTTSIAVASAVAPARIPRRPALTDKAIVSRRKRAHANAIIPNYLVAPVGGCITLKATGNPAAGTGGLQYGPWEVVAAESDGSASLGTGCTNTQNCRIKGTAPGVVTVRVQYRNAATGQTAEDKVQVRFVDVKLTVEEFSVENDKEIIRDNPVPPTTPPAPPAPPPFQPIKDPIWKSTNAAADNEPVMITRSDALAFKVKFKLDTPLAEELKNVDFSVKVLGGGMTGTIVGKTNIPANQSTFEVKFDKGKIVGQWQSQIIPNLLFTFEALPPSDCAFPISSGMVEIKAYSAGRHVTFPVYLSVLNIATEGSAVPLTNKNQLISKVWNKFGGGSGASINGTLKAWDGNPTFKYYPNGTTFGGNAPDLAPMLKQLDGASKCGAFGPLMGQALALNGLDAYPVVVRTILATDPRDPYTDGMLVKNWSLSTTPTYAGLAAVGPYKWLFETASGSWEMAVPPDVNPGPYGDITSNGGVPGQNSSTPSQKAHVNHAILRVQNRFLDPSYGLEYTSEADFETKALDGYFTTTVPPAAAPAKLLARKKPYGVNFWIISVPY
jgi:hypothetical protein